MSYCRVRGQTINDAVAEAQFASTFTQFTLAGVRAITDTVPHGHQRHGRYRWHTDGIAVYSEVVALFNSASPPAICKRLENHLMMNTNADDNTKAVRIPTLRALCQTRSS